MKRFCAPLIGVLTLALLPLCAQSSAPLIVFDNQNKDFGTVTEGEPLKHVFRFTNKGNATLEIVKVEPS